MAAINIPEVREELGVSALQFGTVITAGMWTYAATAPFTGTLANTLGGRRAFLAGVAGSGCTNLAVLALPVCLPNAAGWVFSVSLSLVFSINMIFQGLGTAAAIKLVTSWYLPEEKGLFSGLFNVWITLGYFLAMTVEPHITRDYGWPYVFACPGCLMLLCFSVSFYIVRASPTLAGLEAVDAGPGASAPLEEDLLREEKQNGTLEDPLKQICSVASTASTGGACEDPSQLWSELLGKPIFQLYCLMVAIVCCVRDSLITWCFSFLTSADVVTSDGSKWVNEQAYITAPPPNEALGIAIFAGAAFGGITLGAVSDRFFAGKRLEPLALFTTAAALAIYQLGSISRGAHPWFCIGIIFTSCFFTLGSYTMLSYCVPIDLGVRLAPLAAGFTTCIGYLGSGIGGVVSAGLISEGGGYESWRHFLLFGMVGVVFCAIAGRFLLRNT